jgi:DNA-directed RNA polymerase specialized sigma24 family protein
MAQMSNKDQPNRMDSQDRTLSGIERAFDSSLDIQPPDREPSPIEAIMDPVLKDREEYIKMYQPAVMSYIRSLLRHAAIDPNDLSREVGVVWSNLVNRLLSGDFESFRQTKNEKSFRTWIRRLIHSECNTRLQMNNSRSGDAEFDSGDHPDQECELADSAATDRTLEEVLRKSVIDLAYDEIKDDGLNGAAVLFATQRSEGFTFEELAEHLTEKGGRTITVDAAQKRLQRGRELFAQTLIEQAARLDGTEDLDRITVTLVELELMAHCKKALAHLRSQSETLTRQTRGSVRAS